MTGAELPEGVWRCDRIEHGWRYWGAVPRRYSEPVLFRSLLNTAIREMIWHPVSGVQMPMWPALGLKEVLDHGRFDFVAELGFSSAPLAYPEDAYLDGDAEGEVEPIWVPLSLLGVKQVTGEGWQISYFLDRGLEISSLAVDFVRVEHPGEMSVLCGLGRHHECAGSFPARRWLPVGQVPCRCECGCWDRSQRRSADDRGDQPTDELDDLEPNGQSGTITHEEPPEKKG